MNHVDKVYGQMIVACLAGEKVQTRNGACYRAICQQAAFTTVPLVSLRRTAWKNALREWEWFMSGSNRIEDLHESVRPWWASWATPRGRVRHNYSRQFRRWNRKFDQISHLIEGLKAEPYSRRHVVTTWNADRMASPECLLPSCHGTVIQFFCHTDGTLSMKTYQRSADLIVGVPHNWIQYAAFMLWICALTGRRVGTMLWEGGDVHVYEQHLALAQRMIEAPTPGITPLLEYRPSSEAFLAEDFSLTGDYAPSLDEKAELVL